MKKLNSFLFLFFGLSTIGIAQTVTIGSQTWTTKNLDVDTFRNGDAILEVKTANDWVTANKNKQPAWCYYENDANNGTKYGKLYNWYAVNDERGLAPTGWHVPTDNEWTELSTFLGGEMDAGTKMKSTSGWSENGNGTNSSSFTGLPGGSRWKEGGFLLVYNGGYWWTASKGFSLVYARYLYSGYGLLSRGFASKKSGLSVRCVKD